MSMQRDNPAEAGLHTMRAMRPFEGTMPLDEARAIIDRTIEPIGRTERVRVLEASGRVLARLVTADADVPPFSRAAMDGYAVRAADTAGASRQSPMTLRCIEQTFTGQVARESIGPGQCIEVATGATWAILSGCMSRGGGSGAGSRRNARPRSRGRGRRDVRTGC